MFVFYMLQLGPANYSLPLANIKKDKILLKHSLPQGPVMQQTVPGPLQKKKKSPMGAIKCQENGVPGMSPFLSTSKRTEAPKDFYFFYSLTYCIKQYMANSTY